MSNPSEDVVLGTVEQALDELRAGRPVLVADNEDRENEADVVLAAQTASTEWVAWTIRHSSGYLCAPMTAERADALELPLMVPHSQDPRRTAYTVTVDAAEGITTGISAADRARTIRVLAEPTATAADLIRPGHVLPLRAVPGGVLHRAGHTEAAVDLSRLAGLEEVAAIAELVHDDGTMMRLPAASAMAEREGLVVITIAQLVEWRRTHGDLPDLAPSLTEAPHLARVEETSRAALPTRHGDLRIHAFRDLRTGAAHAALVSRVAWQDAPLVRVHSECLTGDSFGSLRCDCGPQLDTALARVAREGGIVVYLRGHEGRGIGLLSKIDAYALQDEGRDTIDANLELGWPVDRREYGAAAAILRDLGVERVRLMTNNPAKVAGLQASGIAVIETLPIEVGRAPENELYLRTKAERMGHWLSGSAPSADDADDDAPHAVPADGAAPVLPGPTTDTISTTDTIMKETP